jgi:hypothetical protein
MKTARCFCKNRLFFNNFYCLACNRAVGRCNHCRELASFETLSEGRYKCLQCGSLQIPCPNRSRSACNSFVGESQTLCQWCKFTQVLPDLSKPVNVERWVNLEREKRRVLVQLDELDLPPYVADIQQTHPLVFHFLEDATAVDAWSNPIYTGHADGVITINIREADSDYRESTRLALGEPQRTLIGHMRHEIGHYIDWCFASVVAHEQYKSIFGDPNARDYEEAKRTYYAAGAPPNWANTFVSAYATMHPWEDFAETVNVYLDIAAIAHTANDQQLARINLSPQASCEELVAEVLKIAVAVSEFNLDLGLTPILTERISQSVIEKLSFVHNLRSQSMLARLTCSSLYSAVS